MNLFTKTASISLLLLMASCGGRTDTTSTSEESPLKSRLSYIYSPVNLVQTNEEVVENRFEHIASVAAPVDIKTGQTLQSTSVTLASNSMAIVSYNNVGSDISGALDLIDVSDPQKPMLVQSLNFEESEFSDVVAYNNYVIAVGVDYNFGAIAKVFEFVDEKLVFKSNYDLIGHYATNIQIIENNIYINIGDNFGAVKLNINSEGEMYEENSYLSENSLFIAASGDSSVLLRSDEIDTISILDQNLNLNTSISIANFSKDAPAEILVNNDSILTNSLDGKLLQYNKENGEMINQQDVLGTGNGLAMSGNNLFLAQGEEGLHNYEINGSDLNYKGKLDFENDSGSANSITIHPVSNPSVSKYTDIIYQGDGLGGLKIIAFKAPSLTIKEPIRSITSSILNLPLLTDIANLPSLLIKNSIDEVIEIVDLKSVTMTSYDLIEQINLNIDTEIILEIDAHLISNTTSIQVCIDIEQYLKLGLTKVRKRNIVSGLITELDLLVDVNLCILATEELILNF